jgi:nicotinic acid mononucleotide adenylyltransferase
MGTDLITNLHRWDDGQRMINNTNCLIFERNGYPSEEILNHENWPKNYQMGYGASKKHPNLLGGISSTEVRTRVKNGVGIQGLVTSSLVDYIEEQDLYTEQK